MSECWLLVGFKLLTVTNQIALSDNPYVKIFGGYDFKLIIRKFNFYGCYRGNFSDSPRVFNFPSELTARNCANVLLEEYKFISRAEVVLPHE